MSIDWMLGPIGYGILLGTFYGFFLYALAIGVFEGENGFVRFVSLILLVVFVALSIDLVIVLVAGWDRLEDLGYAREDAILYITMMLFGLVAAMGLYWTNVKLKEKGVI